MSQKIDEILADLGPAYVGWKDNEKKKDKLKKAFFEAITEEYEGETLAEKVVVEEDAFDLDDAADLVQKRNPGWTIKDSRPCEEHFEFILEEDPAFQPYTTEYEGVVFQRQVVSGSVFVDDERIKEEDPDLWEAITFIPEPKRQLRDLESLEPETQAKVQKYMYEGKPQIKFPAPKVAKD